jgi:hypothetical protein
VAAATTLTVKASAVRCHRRGRQDHRRLVAGRLVRRERRPAVEQRGEPVDLGHLVTGPADQPPDHAGEGGDQPQVHLGARQPAPVGQRRPQRAVVARCQRAAEQRRQVDVDAGGGHGSRTYPPR